MKKQIILPKDEGVIILNMRPFVTSHPEELRPFREKDAPLVISMDGQTGEVPAGTRKAVKLEAVYNGIIIILRKLVVITDRYEYHGLV